MKNLLAFIAIKFTEKDTVDQVVYLTASSPIDLYWKLDFFGNPYEYEFKPIDHIAVSFKAGIYDEIKEKISRKIITNPLNEEEHMVRPMPKATIEDCSGCTNRFQSEVWFLRDELYSIEELFDAHEIIDYENHADITTQNNDIRLGWIGTPFESHAERKMPLVKF